MSHKALRRYYGKFNERIEWDNKPNCYFMDENLSLWYMKCHLAILWIWSSMIVNLAIRKIKHF